MTEREELLEAEIRRLFAKWADEVVRAGDMQKALNSAVASEREACARVAESGADYALPQMAEFQRSIARAIRSRVER